MELIFGGMFSSNNAQEVRADSYNFYSMRDKRSLYLFSFPPLRRTHAFDNCHDRFSVILSKLE